ncbi:MAG: SDR family NAD(P)-dependent oxidoreductase [Nitrospirae bacterium]|nr:SDR family NAD(P)-dependent oxidoreductase [Nitrospirota bacterium]
MLPLGSLKDQVAVITGGGTGLGKAMADEFGRLGARLVLASRKKENLDSAAEDLRKRKIEVLTVQMDVRKPEDFVNGDVFTMDGGEWLNRGIFRALDRQEAPSIPPRK